MMKTLKVLGIDKALKIVLSIVLAVSIITPLQHVYATTEGEEPVVTETTGTETTEVQNTADTQKVDEEQQVNNPTETEVTYEIQNTEAPTVSETPVVSEEQVNSEETEVLEPEVSKDTEEVEEEYELHIFHYLSIDLGDFYKEEVVTLNKSNLEYGYDAVNNALSRIGLELLDESVVVGFDDFDEDLYGEAWLQYGIADGYKAVLKEGAELTSTFSSAQYIGQLDDIEIVPEEQKAVKFSFEYENGTLVKAPETLTLDEDKTTKKFTGTYTITDIPVGYHVVISTVEGAKLNDDNTTVSLNFEDNSFVEIKVTFVGNDDGSYKVIRRYEQLDGSFEEKEETVKAKVGSETQVEANTPTGYSVEAFDQAFVAGNGTTEITINYFLNTYTVTYNSNGGSYVASQSGKYNQQVTLYQLGSEGTEATRGDLTCGTEAHTHTDECYEWSWDAWEYVLICTKTEHSHTDDCYEMIPGTPPVSGVRIPTRQGYTFAGWYQDESLTTPAPESTTLTGNMTLYAKWVASTVNYTVAYFKEYYDNSTKTTYYAFDSSATKTAEVGTEVTATNDKSFKYYTYNSELSETKKVAADGSTVVIAYYSLIRYTFVFNLNDSNAKIVMNDTEYTGSNYKIENVVLGQDISKYWPTADNTTTTSTSGSGNNKKNKYFDTWNGTYKTKRFEVTSDLLDNASGTTVTFKADWTTTSNVKKVEYWLEKADGTGYEKNETYSQDFIQSSGDSLSAKQIYGYEKINTPDGYTKSGTTNGIYVYRFYYNRLTNSISYYSGSTLIETKGGIKFGYKISTETYNFTPSKPDGLDSEAYFAGWYDNSGLTGEQYVFTTMPATNLALYAKWALPEKTVNVVDENGTTTTDPGVIKVTKGQTLNINTPEKEGYEFAGWFVYTDGPTDTPFDINAPVESNVKIYAKWTVKTHTTYSVYYRDANNKDVATAKENVRVRIGSNIIERAKAVDGMIVDEYQKSLEAKADGTQNVITFTYVRLDGVTYDVKYVYAENFPDSKLANTEYTSQNNIDPEGKVTLNVYPNNKIAKELNAAGLKLNESRITKTLTASDNTVVFTISPKTYTVTYQGLDGVTGWANNAASNPNRITYTKYDSFTLVNPVKTGYVFDGWTLGTGTSVVGDNSHDKFETTIGQGTIGNLTFVANWIKPEISATEYNGTYDGSSHTISNVAVTTLGVDITNQFEITYKVNGGEATGTLPTFTDVTDTTVTVVATNKLFGYQITKDVKVVISKRSVTLTSADASKKYDEAPLTNNTVTVTGDGFVTGEGATYNVTGSQTTVGNSKNEFTYSLNEGTKAGNYEITKVEGTLTVTKADAPTITIDLSAENRTKKYDGNELKATASCTKSDVVYSTDGGKTWSATAPSITDVGSKTVKVKTTNTNYSEATTEYTLTVTKRSVTLTSADASKKYDEAPLTNNTVTVTGDGFVTGEGATYNVTGSQTTVGNSKNEFTYSLNEGTKAGNYEITKVEGTLEVFGQVTYDGNGSEDTVPTDTNEYAKGDEIAVSNEEVTMLGAKFMGWSLTKNEVATSEEELNAAGIITETIMGEESITLYAVWAIDEVGKIETTPVDPEKPDGPTEDVETGDDIPDFYQVRVDFVAVNGSVEFDHVYVTLYEDGVYSENGTGYLTEDQIPETYANSGYHNGTWDEEPSTETAITEDVTYTITFAPVPATPAEVEPEPTPSPRPFVPNPIVTPDVEPTETPEVTPTPTTTPEVIVEPETPQAARDNSWALLNLICSAGTVLLGLFLLISKTKKEEEEDEDEQKGFANEDDEANHYKRNKLYRLLGVVTAVASVLVFIFTEDMRAKMVIIDRWTLLMVVLLFVNVVTFYLGRRWQEDEDEEEEVQQ